MFSREYMSALLILVEFMEKGHEFCHFWAILHFGTGTQTRVVPVPIDRTKVVPVPRQSDTSTTLVSVPRQCGTGTNLVPVPRQSGIGTIHQKGVRTGTNPSGADTNASSSPDICVLALLSPNSYTDGIGTLTND